MTQAITSRRTDAFIAEVKEEVEAAKPQPLWRQIGLTVGGLLGVSLGATWTVDHAVLIASGAARKT